MKLDEALDRAIHNLSNQLSVDDTIGLIEDHYAFMVSVTERAWKSGEFDKGLALSLWIANYVSLHAHLAGVRKYFQAFQEAEIFPTSHASVQKTFAQAWEESKEVGPALLEGFLEGHVSFDSYFYDNMKISEPTSYALEGRGLELFVKSYEILASIISKHPVEEFDEKVLFHKSYDLAHLLLQRLVESEAKRRAG